MGTAVGSACFPNEADQPAEGRRKAAAAAAGKTPTLILLPLAFLSAAASFPPAVA